jgi:hypothetical protein
MGTGYRSWSIPDSVYHVVEVVEEDASAIDGGDYGVELSKEPALLD